VHHVILTRFSVYYSNLGTPSDDWFRERLRLLADYTLPSVQAQAPAPDQWLVFIHATTPQWVRAELGALLGDVAHPTLLVMQEPYTEHEVQTLVTAALPPNVVRLATTLLDSDDVLGTRFCAELRSSLEESVGAFLNFTRGIQVCDGRAYHRSDPSNPFLTYVEDVVPGQNVRTALLDWHNRVRDHAAVHQIRTDPLWCQVVHGGNMQNAIHGIRMDPVRAADLFPIDLALEPVSRAGLAAAAVATAVRLVTRVVRRPHRIIWALRVLPWPGRRRAD